MFEFLKLCNEYEKLSALQRGAILTEKSVKNLSEAERAALIRVITEGVKAIYRTENAEKTK